jgi:hypothetical protein
VRAPRGHFATAALALAALALTACTGSTNESGATTIVEPTTTTTEDTFSVGLPSSISNADCLADSGGGDPQTISYTTVPCDQAHDYQVLTVLEPDDSASYPGQAQLLATADTRCEQTYADSPLGQPTNRPVGHITPTEPMWTDGERRIICVVAVE